MKIAVKIVTGDGQATAGLVDAKMLKQMASEVVRVPDDILESSVCGGVLPMTRAEYDLLDIPGGPSSALLLEDGEGLLLEDDSYLLLEA